MQILKFQSLHTGSLIQRRGGRYRKSIGEIEKRTCKKKIDTNKTEKKERKEEKNKGNNEK